MRIPDTLCDEIKKILPKEKPFSTIVGRPVTPCRKVLDSIYMSFEQDVRGRCFQKNIDQVPPIVDDSKNKIKEVFSKNLSNY